MLINEQDKNNETGKSFRLSRLQVFQGKKKEEMKNVYAIA